MFITPYFGGCKYTNNFLFINKNIEFQQFDLLITSLLLPQLRDDPHKKACRPIFLNLLTLNTLNVRGWAKKPTLALTIR